VNGHTLKLSMGVLVHILVVSAVIALSEATCDETHRLAPGDQVTIEDIYEGRKPNKCKNKFMCAERGEECDIVVKCEEFSFASGRRRFTRAPDAAECRKNFFKVNRDKYCDATGAPDVTVTTSRKLKIIAKGKNYAFSCQISVPADIPTTTSGDYGNYGNYGDYGDYSMGNWSDYGDYNFGNGSDYGFPGMGNGSDYGDYSGGDYTGGDYSGGDYSGGDYSGGDYSGGDYGGPSPTSGPAPTAAPTGAPTAASTPAPTAGPTTAGGNTSSSCCASYTPSADTRIIGGVAVDHGEFPWQAALRSTSGKHSCGGTVISKSWILTAAHCVDSGTSPSSIAVYLGDHNMNITDQGEKVHRVSQIVLGPNTFAANDIALLKLSAPATFSDKIKPACIPTSHASNSFEGKSLWVTGWGTTSQGGGGSISSTLLKVLVPVVSNTVCAQNYAGQANVGENEICAGKSGKDSCQGDSGGPAVWADGDDNRAYIVGVVSWGIGCGNQGYPGVYARVTSYLDWIRATTKGDGICEA